MILSKVISKVRCYNPSESKSISGNVNHLDYIAKRNMAIYNNKGISTFGDIENIKVEETNIDYLKKYILKIASKKINIYRGIISLKEDDAIKLGFDKQKIWKDMMNRNIYDIGKKLGLSISGMEWIAVVHLKKGNPHLHYELWDKNQKINRYFITTKKQEDIRKQLIKDIFSDELSIFYQELNNTKNDLRSEAVTLELKAIDKNYCNGKVAFVTNLKQSEMNTLLKLYNEIKLELPKTGSLKYAYMKPEIKVKIKSFIEELLKVNVELNNGYQSYIETSKKIGALYGDTNKKELEEKAIKQLDNILGNQLLKAIKEINQENLRKQVLVNSIIQDLFRTLTLLVESNNSKYDLYKNYKGEMSKQAKKDYAKNKANASTMEWNDA